MIPRIAACVYGRELRAGAGRPAVDGEPGLQRPDSRRRLDDAVLETQRAGFVGEERRVAELARALRAEDEEVGAGEHGTRRGVRDPDRGRRGERVGDRDAFEAEL